MYSIDFDKFFSYSFSLDCVIFGYQDGMIHVLLIKRSVEPYANEWAIPGDLVYPDEDLPEAASRILESLTSLNSLSLHQGQTFGQPNRHPQGRVISNAYFALVRINEVNARASSWAEKIQWTPIHEVGNLAFDHNEILMSTYKLLKQKLRVEPICFDLLPSKFTINEMQELYEYAFDIQMDKANFRKKIRKIPLIPQKEKQKNVKHRPAKLYVFDTQAYHLMEDDYRFKM